MSLLDALFKPRRPPVPREPKASTLSAAGLELPVLRKSVRALRLSFDKAGRLRATAPWRMSDAVIRAFVESKRGWIEKQQARLALLQAKAQREAEALEGLDERARRALVRQQKRQLTADALALLPRWEPALGVKVSAIGVRAMRSRWGSCNTKTGKIWLSLKLAKHPPEHLEYILLHEMAHLRVAAHDARFKAILDRHLPHWRALNRALNSTDAL